MTKLSEHFTLEEFEASSYAARKTLSNVMDRHARERATKLVTEILEPLRAHFDSPVILDSGYRSPQVNVGVGGSVSSQHVRGEAADIRVLGVSPYDVATWLVDESDLMYDQAIHEYRSWVHVSLTSRYANRLESLTIDTTGTVRGIVK